MLYPRKLRGSACCSTCAARRNNHRVSGCSWIKNQRQVKAYVTQVLVPELLHGDVVTMGNLSNHKRDAVPPGQIGCLRVILSFFQNPDELLFHEPPSRNLRSSPRARL